MSYIIGRNSAGGGGTSTTPTWSQVRNKPFESIDNETLVVDGNGVMSAVGGGSTDTVAWGDVTSKPFNTIDTTTGLTIVDGTLMLETLDHVATIDYVDGEINGITATLESDYALKSEIPDVSDFITASDLTPYAESADLAAVATSGDYEDLSNKPTIPTVPTNVSSFTNDAGYVTSAVTTGLATEAYVNAATTALNIPDAVSVSQTLQSGTAIADITVGDTTTTLYAPAGGGSAPTPNWNATSGQDGFIMNKPKIQAGSLNGTIIGTGGASGNSAIGMGNNVYAKGLNAIVIGKDIMNNYVGQYSSDPNMFFGDGVNPYTTSPAVPTMYRGYKNLNWNDISNPQVNYLDLLGNGTSANARSNAEATDWDGNKYLAGNIYVGVTNWANPTTGAACIPPQADFDWAEANGYVINNSDDGSVDWAQDIIDNQSYDEWGQPEYTGEIDTVYAFKYYINHTIHNESTGEDDEYDGYYWGCVSADPVPNPNYNVDPNSEEPEEEPEP